MTREELKAFFIEQGYSVLKEDKVEIEMKDKTIGAVSITKQHLWFKGGKTGYAINGISRKENNLFALQPFLIYGQG